MAAKLTVTEAETLAIMLDSASRKMLQVRDLNPATGTHDWCWPAGTGTDAAADMFAMFYHLAPAGIYI